MGFARGGKTFRLNAFLLRFVPFCGQQAARAEYVEKCNRKLVDKMMMIMQVSGGIWSIYCDCEPADRSRQVVVKLFCYVGSVD